MANVSMWIVNMLMAVKAVEEGWLAAAATVVELVRKGNRVVVWVKSHLPQRQRQQQGQQQPRHQQQRRPRSWGSNLDVLVCSGRKQMSGTAAIPCGGPHMLLCDALAPHNVIC
jgi:hypothetical protein